MNSRPHYILLDALRGVAALIVLWYHLFEGYGYEIAAGTGIYTQPCDHGYLAVDFFFILSGFVISYAYDDRMQGRVVSAMTDADTSVGRKMALAQFFRRRLIRLHPMVVISVFIGFIMFMIQGGSKWDFAGNGNPEHVSMNIVLIAMLLNLFMLPCIPGQPFDVRGNGEMFPLNGPLWSLFFEYIGNILYALFLCRLRSRYLYWITFFLGSSLSIMVGCDGYLGVGWTLSDFGAGLVRMLFPYCLGIILARRYRRVPAKQDNSFFGRAVIFAERHAFLICAAALVVFLSMPFIGDPDHPWHNGLYILLLLFIAFPSIVWLAARGSEYMSAKTTDGKTTLQYRFFTVLGELSYPLYAVHYPIMYLFFWYIGFPNVDKPMSAVWHIAAGVVVLSIVLAAFLLYCFDKPVRHVLKRFG